MYKQFEKEWSELWFSFILENPDREWDWDEISKNPNITWDIIRENPDREWNWYHGISYNPNITW